MADLCKQCSEETFGEDFRDLAGLTAPYLRVGVICEGCGPRCIVDDEGECKSLRCLKNHGTEE